MTTTSQFIIKTVPYGFLEQSVLDISEQTN
jgi:hypothetical protein